MLLPIASLDTRPGRALAPTVAVLDSGPSAAFKFADSACKWYLKTIGHLIRKVLCPLLKSSNRNDNLSSW